jgi:hypothetical protein
MSSLRGVPGTDSLTLQGSIDALAAAARRAGRPGTVWLGGIAYQLVVLGWFSGAAVAGPVLQDSFINVRGSFLETGTLRWRWLPGLEEMMFTLRSGTKGSLLLVPFALLLFRMAGGLARVAAPQRWNEDGRRPGWRRLWRGGKGLTVSGFALWLQFLLMMFGATLLFIGPAQLFVSFVHLDELGALTAILSGVLLVLLLVYSFLLSVLFQIALHSLVANRRGVGSAVLHAWRIAKNDPMGTARAAAADALLTAAVAGLQLCMVIAAALLHLPAMLLWIPLLGMLGLVGVARCIFWAQVYRTLGGISTLDPDVPGGEAA